MGFSDIGCYGGEIETPNLDRLAANGQIPAFKLGGTWRFRRTELDRWIASRIDTHGHSKSDGVEK